jgi:hypothetical protein
MARNRAYNRNSRRKTAKGETRMKTQIEVNIREHSGKSNQAYTATLTIVHPEAVSVASIAAGNLGTLAVNAGWVPMENAGRWHQTNWESAPAQSILEALDLCILMEDDEIEHEEWSAWFSEPLPVAEVVA